MREHKVEYRVENGRLDIAEDLQKFIALNRFKKK